MTDVDEKNGKHTYMQTHTKLTLGDLGPKRGCRQGRREKWHVRLAHLQIIQHQKRQQMIFQRCTLDDK